MSGSTIRGVLFDKDGTLFDFAATWESWAASFLKRLAPDPERARGLGAAIGFDTDTQRFEADSVVIAGTPGEVVHVLLQYLDGWTPEILLALLNEEAAQAPQAEAVPLAPFLDGLRASGLVLGVATNDAEAPAKAHLGAADVLDRFDFVAGFDSGFGGKPAPGQMKAFCRATGLDPEDCVMVGDSLHDLRAGRAAGFSCVGVLTGFATREELAPFADAVLPDVGHLPGWLGL